MIFISNLSDLARTGSGKGIIMIAAWSVLMGLSSAENQKTGCQPCDY
jgi:hypothetical protein